MVGGGLYGRGRPLWSGAAFMVRAAFKVWDGPYDRGQPLWSGAALGSESVMRHGLQQADVVLRPGPDQLREVPHPSPPKLGKG